MNLMLIPKGGNRLTGEFPRSAIDEEKNLCRTYSMETEEEKETSKGAVYTAFVAPCRPKNESVTDGPTDQRTEGRTHAHIESLRRD